MTISSPPVRSRATNVRRRHRAAARAAARMGGSRVALVLLLVYQAVFLNVFVPSHTPATITVDGSAPAAARVASSHHCCDADADHDAGAKGEPKSDDSSDRSRCAVCNLVARLTPPVTVDLKLPEHGLLELLPLHPPHVAESAPAHPTYLGRGPPARAVTPVVSFRAFA